MPEPHQNRAAQEAELAAAKERYNRIALAYHAVFGHEGARTPAQMLVIQDMEERGYIHRTTMVPTREGIVQHEKMEHAEGQRSFVLNTKNLIRIGYEAGNAKDTGRKSKTKT